jgi:hypothetical protein
VFERTARVGRTDTLTRALYLRAAGFFISYGVQPKKKGEPKWLAQIKPQQLRS